VLVDVRCAKDAGRSNSMRFLSDNMDPMDRDYFIVGSPNHLVGPYHCLKDKREKTLSSIIHFIEETNILG
jgi:hypothetical protein